MPSSFGGELLGDARSPGGGELTSSSPGLGDAAEFGVMEPDSSSPSTLSPSSGEPSSPPSPGKEYYMSKINRVRMKPSIIYIYIYLK